MDPNPGPSCITGEAGVVCVVMPGIAVWRLWLAGSDSDGAGGGVVFGVRDGQEDLRDAFSFRDVGAFARQVDKRLTGGVVDDLDVLPANLTTPTRAEKFQDSFLGGKSSGDVWQGVFELARPCTLRLGEHALAEAIAVTLKNSSDPSALDQVNPVGNDVHDRSA